MISYSFHFPAEVIVEKLGGLSGKDCLLAVLLASVPKKRIGEGENDYKLWCVVTVFIDYL